MRHGQLGDTDLRNLARTPDTRVHCRCDACPKRQISHSGAPPPPGTEGPRVHIELICVVQSVLPVTLGDGLLGGGGVVRHEDLPGTGQLAVPAWMSRTAERGCPVASQGGSLPVMRRAS